MSRSKWPSDRGEYRAAQRKKALDQGLCRELCGRPRVGDKKQCEECAERTRARARRISRSARDSGYCMICHQRKATDDRVTCAKCRRYHSERRKRHIETGICVSCAKNPVTKGRVCEVCVERRKELSSTPRAREVRRQRRERLIAAGLCLICAKNRTERGYLNCRKCLDAVSRYGKKRRAAARVKSVPRARRKRRRGGSNSRA